MTAFAAEWKNNDTGWWYEYDDGTYPANKLEKIGNYWYYFNEIGYAQQDWLQLETGWYSFNNNGICVNPIDPVTQLPVGSPYPGWILYHEIYGSKEDLGAIPYNDLYWIKLYDMDKASNSNATECSVLYE
jgi:hypothetical protein